MRMKNVLLIGDSIRLGYCRYVKKSLFDIADVHYPEDNCRFTQYTLVSLPQWIGAMGVAPEKIDVIHWNNGHWDVAHWNGEDVSLNSLKMYSSMLLRIYRKLHALCPNAKIIFALTTPVNTERGVMVNPRGNDEIEKYNAAATELMKRLNVEINDLYSLVKNEVPADFYIDQCHFNESGYQILGQRVSGIIRANLQNPHD